MNCIPTEQHVQLLHWQQTTTPQLEQQLQSCCLRHQTTRTTLTTTLLQQRIENINGCSQCTRLSRYYAFYFGTHRSNLDSTNSERCINENHERHWSNLGWNGAAINQNACPFLRQRVIIAEKCKFSSRIC